MVQSIRTDGRCWGDIADSSRRMTNAAGSMPLLSTVIRPTAFLSSHSDEATWGRSCPSSAVTMCSTPKSSRDGCNCGTGGSSSFASGTPKIVRERCGGPPARQEVSAHRCLSCTGHRSEGPSNLRIDTPSLHSFKTPRALLPRDIERVMCLYLRVKHAYCGQADLIWESGRKPVTHRRKPKN